MASLIDRVHDLRLFVAHGTLDLIDLDTFEDVPLDYAANGLVSARENYAAVVCATEGGDIDVTAELWDGPPTLHLDDWQDAAEISITWTTTRICIGPGEENPEDAPQLALPGPGTYRLLVHGRHRDDGDVRDEGDPVETYLFQLWPAPLAGPVTHKAASRFGASLRSEGAEPKGQVPSWFTEKTSGYGPDHPAYGS
ncbi:hypothetical protein ACWDBD_49410 [Streptomyces sp. NPDC001118]|uniref:hypothetical protein n=1 Tax=unclassified Streptomyces TaxID=2593676 RepID=UPI00332A4C9A